MSGIPEYIESCLRRFETLDVLVVGDVMLDEYLHGDVERVSPEAPVPVVAVARESRALGGAGNVVRNLAALGARPQLCTVVGADEDGQRIVGLLKDLGIDTSGVVVDETRCTTRKTRILARDQQMIRADREDTHGLVSDVRRDLDERVSASLSGVHGVALIDYGKGVLDIEGARATVELATAAGRPVAVDPKGHLESYAGAELVKPNRQEALDLLGPAAPIDGAPLSLARALAERLGGADVAITLGADGMVVCSGEPGAGAERVPTAGLGVYDVQGAGDTSLAALWLSRLAGAGLADAALVANAASGVAVSKVGTATATLEEVRAHLPAVLEAARHT